MREIMANLLAISGIACITVGAWIIHPSVGLVVAGTAALLVGIGLVREKQNDR